MAARTAPARTAAQHQSLLHFVGVAPWSDEAVLAKVREMVLPSIEKRGPIEAWIIDDTSFPKQGQPSVGVQHQYCGQLGKQANCQVAVTVSIANHAASLPVAYRLYLPQTWVEDAARREEAGVPQDISFKTKPEIALEQVQWAYEAGLPRGVVMFDVAYGNDSRLRTGISALSLTYVAGIEPNVLVWPSGIGPRRRGKPLNNTGRRDEPDLISAKELAVSRPKRAWRTITWREGSADRLSSRFARARRCRAQSADSGSVDRGVAADRVAAGRSRADQILALDAAGEHQLSAPRRFCQVALAHRARLSGTQAGGWARPLRGARMARLPSSRHAVHRGLRIPDLRARDDSPLRTSFHRAAPGTCCTRRLSTQRIRPCGLNVTFQIRSQPCALA